MCTVELFIQTCCGVELFPMRRITAHTHVTNIFTVLKKKPQREKKRKHVNTFTKPIQTTKKQKIRRNYYTLKVFSCEHQHMSSRIEKVRETCDKSKKKKKTKNEL